MNKETIKILKVLGHQTRIKILETIQSNQSNSGNLCYNNVAEQLKLPATTINFHIKKLEDAKLIFSKNQNGKSLLNINNDLLEKTKKDFSSF